jgi:branched-chain amino acid aminotransferase
VPASFNATFSRIAGGRAAASHTRRRDARKSSLRYVAYDPCLDPKIKSLSRLHFNLAVLEGKAAGADVAIMLDLDGHVTEGPGFNVFVVRSGEMFSPPEGILMGITRQTVFELAAEHGLPVREAQLTAFDLHAADEVFLTSTAGGIMPIVEIDGRVIGDGKPGRVFQRIHGLYWALRESGRHGTPIPPGRPG